MNGFVDKSNGGPLALDIAVTDMPVVEDPIPAIDVVGAAVAGVVGTEELVFEGAMGLGEEAADCVCVGGAGAGLGTLLLSGVSSGVPAFEKSSAGGIDVCPAITSVSYTEPSAAYPSPSPAYTL